MVSPCPVNNIICRIININILTKWVQLRIIKHWFLVSVSWNHYTNNPVILANISYIWNTIAFLTPHKAWSKSFFFYVNLNKLLNTRSSYPCFETKTRRSCDVTVIWAVTIKWHEIFKIECLECSYRFENLYANEQANSIYGLLGTAI